MWWIHESCACGGNEDCGSQYGRERLIGIALLVLGALPLLLVISGCFMWTRHMWTIGLSLDSERGLAVLLVVGIACIATGLCLIKSRSDATEE
jgi:hypothetical protein